MQWKTTLRLMLLVCLTAGTIGFVKWRDRLSVQDVMLDIRLPTPRAEDVRQISIETERYSVRCIRRNGGWRMTSPFSTVADSGRIEHMLSVIETLAPREIVTPEHRARRDVTLADYGLAPPLIRIVLFDGLSERTLDIGHAAPLGDMVYARLSEFDDVFALDTPLKRMVPPDIEFLRDRSLMTGNMRRANRLEIQRPRGGFVRLDKIAPDHWVLQQPIVARADVAAVTAMLDILQETQVERFVWDRRVDEAVPSETRDGTLVSYRLTPDEASARITVWIEGEDIPRELVLGRETDDEPGSVYARLRDSDAIVAVSAKALTVFSIDNINTLRDRRLFGLRAAEIAYAAFQSDARRLVLERGVKAGWRIVEPVQWKADEIVVGNIMRQIAELRIERFADDTETDLAVLGLDPPALRLQAAPAKPDHAVQHRLMIGRTTPQAEVAYVRFEDQMVQFGEGATVYAVSARALEALGSDLTRPLALRDRTMLALAPDQVRSLTRIRGEARQRVERKEDGTWTADEGGDVVAEAVESILFAVANMRAHKVESHNPEDWVPYGLDRPTTILMIGLSGEAGIRKSVMLGRGAGADGVYAMIQGQDIVFTLENSVARILTADLTADTSASAKAE